MSRLLSRLMSAARMVGSKIRSGRWRPACRRQCGAAGALASHRVVAGPIGHHLPVCDRAHRLRHAIPIGRLHAIPRTRVYQYGPVLLDHPAGRLRASGGSGGTVFHSDRCMRRHR